MVNLEEHGCYTGDCPHVTQDQCDTAIAQFFAEQHLAELTPYMSDKERERLLLEDRSETFRTYTQAFYLGLVYGRKTNG